MPEDRSLDDFAGRDPESDETKEGDATDEAATEATADAEADADAEPAVDDADAENGEETTADAETVDDDSNADVGETNAEATKFETDTPEPPSVTATWATDGVACELCDAEVQRRWACDGDYVCADCKDW